MSIAVKLLPEPVTPETATCMPTEESNGSKKIGEPVRPRKICAGVRVP